MSLYTILDREKFSPAQWVEIVAGAEKELDYMRYADPVYTAGQMEQIRLGLTCGLDVSMYANPAYTEKQMYCLRRGLSCNINPVTYADPSIPEQEMMERMNQLIEKNNRLWDRIPLGAEVARYVFEEGGEVAHLREDGSDGPTVTSIDEFKVTTGLFSIGFYDSFAKRVSTEYYNERHREEGFLAAELPRFGIYQRRDRAKSQGNASITVGEAGEGVRRGQYRLVHDDYFKPGDTVEKICQRFQCPSPPTGFHHRPLKTGDVIALQEEGKTTAYLLGQDVLKELHNFWGRKSQTLNDGHRAAYRVGDDRHLTIQQEDGGFHYTLYANDFLPMDGGHPRTDSLEAALDQALTALSLEKDALKEINFEEFCRMAQLTGREPTVRIVWSGSPDIEHGALFSLSDADALFQRIDQEQSTARQAPDFKGWPYKEMRYELEYMMEGRLHHYIADQFLGDGDGGIISHINTFYTTQRNDPAWQNEITKMGDRDSFNARYDYALQVFVPYLKYHVALSTWATFASSRLAEGKDNPEEADKAVMCGCQAILKHIELCRREHNTAHDPEFPPAPNMNHFYQDPGMASDRVDTCCEIWHEAHSFGLTPSQYAANGYCPPEGHREAEAPAPHTPPKPHRRPKRRDGHER